MAAQIFPEEVAPTYQWNFPHDDLDDLISHNEFDEEAVPERPLSECYDPGNIPDAVGDANSTKPVYVNECPGLLPAEAPVGHGHLLNIVEGMGSEFNLESIHLHIADAVATVLWKRDSESLRAFLDHKVEKFSFVHRYGTDSRGIYSWWTIQRHKNYVLVGCFNKLPGADAYYINWEIQVVYKIKKSGSWVPFLASINRKTFMYHDIVYDAIKRSKYRAENGIAEIREITFLARRLTTLITMWWCVPGKVGPAAAHFEWCTSNHKDGQSLAPGKRTGFML